MVRVRMKKIALGVGIFLILLAVPLTVFLIKQQQDIRQRAAPATTLALSPPQLTVTPNQTFSLDVVVDTGSNQITGAQIKVVFDPDKLEAQSIQKGSFLPNIQVAGEVAPGSASIVLGAPSTQPGSGTGKLATITFKALVVSDAPVTVRFAEGETAAVALQEQNNVLISGTPSLITISGSGTGGTTVVAATTTPTVRPSATATPAPTASVSAAVKTKITSPTEGAVTGNKPTITGTTFNSGTVTITISGTNPITTVVTANASGSWSYTPTTTLEPGSHTITVTAQDKATSAVETAVRTFTVSGTGGTQVSTTSGIPVAGSVTTTYALIAIAGTFLFIGILGLAL